MDRNEMMEWMKPFQKTFDQDFFKSFQHVFDNNNYQNIPNIKVNLYEGHNEMLCVFFLPGVDNVESITLKVYSNTIEINGVLDITFNNFSLTQKEVENGDFNRVVQLPYVVREDKVDATYRNGLLIVHLHKLLTNKNNDQRVSIKHIEE